MLKHVLFITALLMSTLYAQANAPSKKKDFMGEWKFDVPNAPYGHQQGTIIIGEKDGSMTGEITFTGGEKVKMEEVAVAEGILTFKILVESSWVKGKATIEGDKFKGTAMTYDGDIPFEATKVKK